jgi:hypothetical protein
MRRNCVFLAAVAGLSLPMLGYVQQPGHFSVEDYTAIDQLTAGYPYKIDNCTNGGYDYADQYTPDGIFGVSSAWGSAGKVWYRGREQLADAGGGGKGGCRIRKPVPGRPRVHHIVTSQMITPTPDGAVGRSTLLAVTDPTADAPGSIEWQGGYEDAYVKTPQGWKFKSRFHTWPGHPWPDTAAEQAKLMAVPKPAGK